MTGSADTGGELLWNSLRLAPWVLAALMLLLPLVAMRFTGEVDWNAADFIVAGALLFGACGAFELAARMTASGAYRAAAAIGIVAALLLVWINLAVGIIGSEDDPANLMFAGVLAIALAGAVMARFRPAGMAAALLATALAQALAGFVALLAGWGSAAPGWPGAVLGATFFFAALWLLSAWLFRKAARRP